MNYIIITVRLKPIIHYTLNHSLLTTIPLVFMFIQDPILVFGNLKKINIF